jgi:hypothetical protein
MADADQKMADVDPNITAVGDVDLSPLNTTPQPAKERHSLTLDQRRSLRRWANSQQTRPSHRACIEWFQREYGQVISQSTVSHSLSPKYSRLDGDNPQLSGSRLRFGNWPDVEKLVLIWYNQTLASGRHPTNEELADKAKNIFTQLPRYKDDPPPEFSPGWIHRFKKRYGLLIRRQRRHGDVENAAEDIEFLADCIPRFMAVTPDSSPAAIRDAIFRHVGVEPSLNICALVRDEAVRRQTSPGPLTGTGALALAAAQAQAAAQAAATNGEQPATDPAMYEDDPEVVLQNALRQLQQQEADAEANAAAVREERERSDFRQGLSATTPRQSAGNDELSLGTMDPSVTGVPTPSSRDRPIRCPFCINNRMLRSIKEAVEHLSTHVVV